MGVFAWITFIGFEIALLLGVLRARQLWRDETTAFDGQPRARVRTFPLVVVGGALAVPCFIVAGAMPPSGPDDIRIVPLVASFLGLAVTVVTSWLFLGVRRGDRHEWAIPPHLREGAERSSRAARGSRRARG